ncbi:histidine kinase response regulator hybrid protein [Striga asiatica]|uniref:Histidine kinase response regulator hybrid protein n=1 Tax=Striga asiatica TaxID=4170 RepID=A0A5A7PPE9_STRAF|nr:histidine kinase response regulator hybrid protein [Striga asiatica]
MHPLFVIYVICGITFFVWDLILKADVLVLGCAQESSYLLLMVQPAQIRPNSSKPAHYSPKNPAQSETLYGPGHHSSGSHPTPLRPLAGAEEERLLPRELEPLRLLRRDLVRGGDDVPRQPPQGGGPAAEGVHHRLLVGVELHPLAPLLAGPLHHREVLRHHHRLALTDLSVEHRLTTVVHDLHPRRAARDVQEAVRVHEPVRRLYRVLPKNWRLI